MQPAEATAFPCDDIALPPTATFEVRIVCWNAKDVVSMDSWTNMNDTYVKLSIEGVKDSQSTDIHWRAKKGKASWNYRLKFKVELGHNTRTMKFPYLNLSMWDKDIVKYDDLIAETVLDLGRYFRRAYKKGGGQAFPDQAQEREEDQAHLFSSGAGAEEEGRQPERRSFRRITPRKGRTATATAPAATAKKGECR